MDFGGQYPAVVHFGNLAIADVINSAIVPIFDDAVEFLPKDRKKAARRKFDFLLDNSISCVPLSANTILVAQELLASFTEKNSLKANFRNSWNDLLIAATALDAQGTLVTEDGLLARHVADYVHASAVAVPGALKITFSDEQVDANRRGRESKGFINQGWRVRFSQNRS
jgi:hypothetical protein